ncbi:MAG: protein kinase, partial [Chloroflexota bacterium]
MTQTQINNRFLLQKQLGAGGMGEVYLAQDRLSGGQVALKQVHIDLIGQDDQSETDFRLLLAHEFQTLSSLRHPNIISVLDYGFDRDSRPFYTMTYLPEKRNILAAGSGLCLEGITDLVRQMLQALAYLHRRKIFHQDIKPDNVLVHNGRLRLLDFGLATVRSNQPVSSSGGTLAYWAPELWLGEPYTEAADLFSAGVIAFELLTGRHPFAPVDSFLLDRVLEEEPYWPALSKEAEVFKPFLSKLLAKTPEDRFQKAGEAIQLLNQLLHSEMDGQAANIRESYLQAATFVGRDTELNQLKTALKEAKGGMGEVWLVGGESGVGKSRLVDEFRAQALVDGWQVVTGQAIDGGGSPYQLWRDAIPHLLLSVEVSDAEASILRQIFPLVDRQIGHGATTNPNLEGGDAQQQITNTILTMLHQQSQPVLLLLEDLQWSKEGLDPLKEMLSGNNLPDNLFVVGTYRNDERPRLPEELVGVKSIVLDRLHSDHVYQLCHAILGDQEFNPDLISLLVQETEGNTLFVVEVLRALAEEAGQLDKINEMLLPESVSTTNMTQILNRRIRQIEAADHRLLQLAAVAGRQIDQELMDQLATEFDLIHWLQRVADAAIFIVRNDQWMFSHDKLRENILSDLDQASRQQMHREIAIGLETIHLGNMLHEATIMEHWRGAGDVDKELAYLPTVVGNQFKHFANFEKAIENINRGLELLPQEDDTARLDLVHWLTDIHVKQGHFETAAKVVKQELELANKVGEPLALAEVLINSGFLAINQRRYVESADFFKQSFKLLDPEKHIHILDNVYHGLGQVEMLMGNNKQALIYHKKSLELREQENDHRGTAFSLNNIGEVYYYQREYLKARPYFEESLAIRYKHADPHSITYALISMAMVQLKLCEPQAKETLIKALESALEVNAGDLIIKAVLAFSYLYFDMTTDEANKRVGEMIGLSINHPSYSS